MSLIWNKLISEQAKVGHGREALRLYQKMREEGVIPDPFTFVAALKACSSVFDIEAGKRIHTHVHNASGHTNIFVSSTLVDMYAKCGSIQDARKVFEKMRYRNVVSWNAMIMGYAHTEMGNLALDLYERMQHQGFTPNARTFVAVLTACASLASAQGGDAAFLNLERGRAIHVEAAKRGFESDIFVSSTLVDMYAKSGSMGDARQVFENMKNPTVVSWNAMILGYAQMKLGDIALELYARMQHKGFLPNARTFVAVLKGCASLAAQAENSRIDAEFLKANYLECGRAIHAEVAQRGLNSDTFVSNTLIDMYMKCGSARDACHVFENMEHLSVVSWTAMISGYAQMEMGDLALELYARMKQEGFIPNARTFAAALNACASTTVYLEEGRAIHVEIAERGFEPDIFISCALVDMYAKCGSIEVARQIFEKMRHWDVVSWNVMITGYTQMEMGHLALELYVRMQDEGIIQNVYTFAAALQVCGDLASLEIGKEVHSQINRAGLQGGSLIAVSLVNMYGKCGSMWDAQQLFESLHIRNSITWNALIAGYSGEGDSECVFDLYKGMQLEGIKPDDITFVSILNVCNHNGLVEKGQTYFKAMCLEFGLFPSYNHYTCMTDLLGRVGQLDEAAAMVMQMPFEPDMVTWMTILGACRKWNNIESGRKSFECAVMLDEKFSAAHTLMTSIYVFSDVTGE